MLVEHVFGACCGHAFGSIVRGSAETRAMSRQALQQLAPYRGSPGNPPPSESRPTLPSAHIDKARHPSSHFLHALMQVSLAEGSSFVSAA